MQRDIYGPCTYAFYGKISAQKRRESLNRLRHSAALKKIVSYGEKKTSKAGILLAVRLLSKIRFTFEPLVEVAEVILETHDFRKYKTLR